MRQRDSDLISRRIYQTMQWSTIQCYLGSVLFSFIAGLPLWAQPLPQAAPAQPSERYRTVLDRLDSITSVPLGRWRFHTADISHPEDPALDDSSWTQVILGSASGNAAGSRSEPGWYRAWIEIPPAAGGKDIHGGRVHLALR